MSEIIRWLNVKLAPCISVHGVLVDVYGEGVLITGESGIGKSEAALELIRRGHRLVTDDIVEIRKIKANLVSVNVDRLVQEGYLERRAVAGDRRKTQLLCTEKAQPVIARGREVQERFFARLLHNTDAATREAFFRTMEVIGKNLDEILKENG
jgi:serine kinase of HPr protein (carbohydrate metabolism regulator)